jgi:hypothetical protein
VFIQNPPRYAAALSCGARFGPGGVLIYAGDTGDELNRVLSRFHGPIFLLEGLKMRYALVDGLQAEPEPRLKGICKSCGSILISKCGKHKLWHWAHKSTVHCDQWWEPETEWHRAWKNLFPKDWQEVIHFDPFTDEKHIADVKTSHGQVIEFQHSPMKPEELRSREEFYKNMAWVIDGCRGELDEATFNMGLGSRIDPPNHPTIFPFQWWSQSKLFKNWWTATCPVFLDFSHPVVWRLALYEPKEKRGVVGPIQRGDLVKILTEGVPLARIR